MTDKHPDTLRAARAAPQQAAPAVRLQWTIDTPPTHGICRYDHCTAESPLGPFRIEWKGWKEHDSHCLYLNGEYIGVALTKDGAKEMAQDHIESLAANLAPYQRSAAPQQAARIPSYEPETGPQPQPQATRRVCIKCNGTGIVKNLYNWGAGGGTREQECWACREEPVPAPSGDAEDTAMLDWLDQNIFHREMNEWDAKYGGRGDQNMWVLFAPKGVQGSARNIINAARKEGK